LQPERKTAIADDLEYSRQTLRNAVAGLTDKAATAKAGPEQWSVLEIVEHVALAERGMFQGLTTARPSETSLENSEKEASITERVEDRLSRGSAPERARPVGRFAALTAAMEEFDAARNETIRFVREHDGDLYRCTAKHPLFGVVNGYELLLIMAGHARRHAAQIEQIKRSAPDTAPRG
jgi:hypothetical protein